jgi:hypothetical protein
MERLEVNIQTGEQRIVQLTPAEIAEINSRPVPTPPAEPTLHEKLASIGLTIDQLKEALK